MRQSPMLQLSHRPQFERNVTRSLVAGAVAGIATLICYGSKTESFFQWWIAAGSVFAFSGGDRFERWVVRGLAGVLALGALMLPGVLGMLVCGSITALLMMLATSDSRGSEGQVAQLRPGRIGFAAAMAMGAMLFPLGTVVGNLLAHRLADHGVPWLFAMPFAGAVAALFTAFAALPAHVLLQDDPVEARGGELLMRLRGEFAELVSQLLGAYRHCGELLSQLPREPARAELAQTLGRATHEALEVAEHWSAVEVQIDSGAREDLMDQLTDLKKSVETSRDELARKQLQLAAASLQEELANLDAVSLKRERALAKLKALCAQLWRTRVSLLGLQAAQTQVKGADLLALSRKVQALAALEATRGELENAEAMGAELDELEASKATVRMRA